MRVAAFSDLHLEFNDWMPPATGATRRYSMSSRNLANLAQRGLPERRAVDLEEIRSHPKTASDLLATARREGAPERGRFFNLYEAAHALSLAGLKLAGYRSKEGEGSRQLVLSLAEQTLALRRGASAVLSDANRLRNILAYAGGDLDVPESILESLASNPAHPR